MKHSFSKNLLMFALVAVVGLCAMITLFAAPSEAASDEPIMRIALFADLHVEFDLQKNEKPMRLSTAKSVQYAKQLTDDKGVDVVLVGGDMSGGRGSWVQKYIPNTKASVYEFMAKATKDGKVLFVTGNHDPEPSAKAKTPAGGDYSGDYSKFMLDNVGKFVSSLYAEDVKGGEKSPYNELLCYRYTINGIEFLGINTPYVADQSKVCGFYAEQTQWLLSEMEKIGKEKTVFLICHYPKNGISTITDPTTAASKDSCQSDMNKLLNQYPKIVYCYGHVHSGESYWAKNSTNEIVVPEGRVSLAAKGIYKNSGIIYAHMGSMGYYDNPIQPGSLSAIDPKVCQFVMVELYANRMSFQIHNTGSKVPPNGVQDVKPIVIARNLAAQFGLPAPEGEITQAPTNTLTMTGDSVPSTSTNNDGEVPDTPIVSDTPNVTTDTPVAPSVDTPVSSDPVNSEVPDDGNNGNGEVDGEEGISGTDSESEIRSEGSSGTVLIVVLCVVLVVLAGAGVAVAVLVKKKK